MKIAFRKSTGSVSDRWVDYLSGAGGFVHTDLIFPDGTSATSVSRFDPRTAIHPAASFCLATGRTGGPIIRLVPFSAATHDIFDLALTGDQNRIVRDWCWETVDQAIKDGAGYDWFGVMRFVFKCFRQHPEDWFCSEYCMTGLQQAGLYAGLESWKYGPNRWREMLS